MPQIRVAFTTFAKDAERIFYVRKIVFVDEQAVPEDIEIDDIDAQADQVLAFCGGELAGTGRVTADGRVGRMAVLAEFRGLGVGREILRALLRRARQHGATEFSLSAQCHAIPFYERHGFVAEGSVYAEAGIDHRWMVCKSPA
jgi:predicted GNAT family N-acyltransferase